MATWLRGRASVSLGLAGSHFDRLVVNGPATLAGALNVTLINGFRPSAGDVFAVMSFGSRTGAFTSMNGLSLGNGQTLVPAFSLTAFTLTATGSVVPSPTLTFSRDASGPFRVQLPGSAGQTYSLDLPVGKQAPRRISWTGFRCSPPTRQAAC